MMHQIVCEICGQSVQPLSSNQRVCFEKSCRSKHRSNLWKLNYYARRTPPTCVWCNERVLEPGKRQYHAECFADKTRVRVRAYNETHKPKPGPKKPRRYKGKISCKICHKRVQRTGARQVICKARECDAALSNMNKRESKARRREIAQIISLKRLRDAQRQPPRRSESEARGDILLRRITF
jgi:hypothetical protein